MDIRQLENFLAVCEEMNVGRAAGRVHLSQPALSRQIQALEAEVGVALFDRSSKSIRLTAAGHHYERELRVVLNSLRNSARTARAIAAGHQGEIKVGIFGSAILDFIPATLERFGQLHPQARVSLASMDKDMQIDGLRRRTLDLGFNRLVPEEPDISVELVRTEPLVLAMRSDNPLASEAQIHLEHIVETPLVLYPTHVRNSLITRVHQLFADIGAAPLVAHEVADLISAMSLISAGLGVGIVPIAATRITLRDVVFRPFAGKPPTVNLACLYRKHDDNPLLLRLLDCVRQMGREQEAPISS
ncbi:MAG TPA: LysR family transcriptional regulator [Novosphingobium sp.]|nr:LysR family transcriptional regulator [Novosphingobium sp.]HZV09263.1 LysR family transcriptional regulator [Novosphingobium sp.]